MSELADYDYSVKVEELGKTFGTFVAVDRVSFRVRPGEIFGFLGSNGAGKTTTIRMLCGLLQPTSGRAWVHGLDVHTQPDEIKQNIGYMSQRFSLYDELTVEENVDFFSGIYGVPRAQRPQRKESVLLQVGLERQAKRITGLLAAGWKQRLALGCAILHRPPILFLDEPTSGVDPLARRAFWELIYQLSSAGHTIFVTTHYMDEAEYCHRLALMHAGSLIAVATPEELRSAFQGRNLMLLEVSDLVAALKLLEDEPEVSELAVFGAGLHLQVEDPEETGRLLRRRLESAGLEVHRLELIEPSIEDVFASLIEQEERG